MLLPFPGILNVLLEEPFPAEGQVIEIENFTEEGRTFGACRCRRILLSGIAAAAVQPERSRYPPELIEVIAAEELPGLELKDRESFGIENKDSNI